MNYKCLDQDKYRFCVYTEILPIVRIQKPLFYTNIGQEQQHSNKNQNHQIIKNTKIQNENNKKWYKLQVLR